MGKPLAIWLPPRLHLTGGYTIRLDALDPATGATVANVTVSNATMQVEDLTVPPGTKLPAVLLLKAP